MNSNLVGEPTPTRKFHQIFVLEDMQFLVDGWIHRSTKFTTKLTTKFGERGLGVKFPD